MTIIDELNQLEHNENTPTKHDLFPFFIAGNSLSIESKRSNPIGLGPFRHPKSLVDKLLRPSPTNLLIPKYKELDIDPAKLVRLPPPSLGTTHFTYTRNLNTGEIDFANFKECESKMIGSSTNSTSLLRDPAPLKDFVRGKSTSIPFAPGGAAFQTVQSLHAVEELTNLSSLEHMESVPPGFDRGIDFGTPNGKSILPMDMAGIFSGRDPMMAELLNLDDMELADTPDVPEPVAPEKDVDDLIAESENIVFNLTRKRKTNREWAHMIDVNLPFPEFHDLVPEMAHSFAFELDVFQKRAVYHLEQSDSVFIAAHTSAGKTVVAEYAIALASKHMTRAIYTSPIKALSNQKFRDFKDIFDDVGILTGDIQINPEAACLVMTTEILRSMLYRGADVIRDVEFVIFDEVHYLNDADRGVVWEEVIIMLPAHVNIVMLSATVPNTKEFADWVGRTKEKDIYVISTSKRPVPLEHYLYADKELFKFVDSKRNFLDLGYKQAYDIFNPTKQDVKKSDNQRGGRGGHSRAAPNRNIANQNNRSGSSNNSSERNIYGALITMLKTKKLLPVIIFSFSKKKCEDYSRSLANVDLTNGAAEKSEIHVFFERSVACLKGSDKELPQVLRMKELVSRGIAIHHGGLLPILKEVVEILFTRGLVKVLFATETFAMGVNAPAKCVVFSMIRKHDGVQFRDLLSGEYTQMSGRAGRRGLDLTGTVIIATNDSSLPEVFKNDIANAIACNGVGKIYKAGFAIPGYLQHDS